ncbi:MAG: sucrase ferredoxin [Pyrinomonadaceae bacterium]
MIYRFALSEYRQLLDVNIAALINGQLKGEEVVQDHPLFLICTHGTHDKCCAKHGIPPYEALRRAGEEAAKQSSYVGGDRFAANLVCLPHGLCYGRVDERGAERIVEEYRQGRLYLPNYRDATATRSHFRRPSFCALRDGLTGIDDLRLLDCTDVREGILRARFSSGGTTVCTRLCWKSRSSFGRIFHATGRAKRRAV